MTRCKNLTDSQVRQVIRALRQGYGVEDIAAKEICSIDEARIVLEVLKEFNLLDRIYKGRQ